MWTGFSWLRVDHSLTASCCEHGDERLGFTQGRELSDQLSHYQLLKSGVHGEDDRQPSGILHLVVP
jgi:hypothetical protein